jgi:hypothetical protein
MKTPALLLIPLFALSPALVLNSGTAAPGTMTAQFFEPTAPEAGDVPTVGDRAINSIGYSLVVEARSVLVNQGAKAAIAKCHLKAIPAVGNVLQGVPRVTAYKRTSLKVRNPANAPDAAEEIALKRVERALDAGNSAPKILVQRVDHANGEQEWRVYRPVAVLAQCVACHGPADSLAEDVKAELKLLYPNDAATGYKAGDWRGLIRVTVAAK